MYHHRFDGADAAIAWRAYCTANTSHFSPAEWADATSLATPEMVYVCGSFHAVSRQRAAIHHLAAASPSILLLGPFDAYGARQLLYVHTRTPDRGQGLASRCISLAQDDFDSLTASACSWQATLLLLRRGFRCDFKTLGAGLTWKKGTERAALDEARQAVVEQRKRRGARARSLAEELEGVVVHLEQNLDFARASIDLQQVSTRLTRLTHKRAMRDARDLVGM